MALKNITAPEFDQRLDAANERLRQELEAAQKRVRNLDELLARKQDFARKLDHVIAEIERDEAEIRAAEKSLRLSRPSRRVKSPA